MSTICVAGIFLLQGLGLRTDELKRAFDHKIAAILPVFVILGLTALCGLFLIQIPFDKKELAIGAALFSAVPTTLTSGVTLVGAAKGECRALRALASGRGFRPPPDSIYSTSSSTKNRVKVYNDPSSPLVCHVFAMRMILLFASSQATLCCPFC